MERRPFPRNTASRTEAPPVMDYDWNLPDSALLQLNRNVELQDETLRDGLQRPSAFDPPIEAKLEILHLMEALGIHGADVGLPGAGPRAVADVTAIVTEIVEQKLKLKPSCAGRTLKVDIQPIIDIAQKTGKVLEADLFIGSSPVRQYAEDWSLDKMVRVTEEAVSYAVEQGLEVMYVTEDTIRSHPDTLRKLYTTAIECGAIRICLCDTVGHATPDGVRALVRFIQGVVKETGRQVKVDWHGHRDRGLGLANTLAAVEAGVDRVHGTALGIGERVGNTPMEHILVNLKLLGVLDNDLRRLQEYVSTVSRHCRVPLPESWPALGRDAFRTTAPHSAERLVELYELGEHGLLETTLSAVACGQLGRRPEFAVGPCSGLANARGWLLQNESADSPEELLQRAREKRAVL